jgi:hypothetical protein
MDGFVNTKGGRICARPGCGRSIPPGVQRSHAHARYCSARCHRLMSMGKAEQFEEQQKTKQKPVGKQGK